MRYISFAALSTALFVGKTVGSSRDIPTSATLVDQHVSNDKKLVSSDEDDFPVFEDDSTKYKGFDSKTADEDDNLGGKNLRLEMDFAAYNKRRYHQFLSKFLGKRHESDVSDIASTTIRKSTSFKSRGKVPDILEIGSRVEQNNVGRFRVFSSWEGTGGIVGRLFLLMHAKPIVDRILGSNAEIISNDFREIGATVLKDAFALMWNGNSVAPRPVGVDLTKVLYHMGIYHFRSNDYRSTICLAEYVNWVITGHQMSKNSVIEYVLFNDNTQGLVPATSAPVIVYSGRPHLWRHGMGKELPRFEIVSWNSNKYVLTGMMITKNKLTAGDSQQHIDVYYMEYPYNRDGGLFHVTDSGALFVETGSDVAIEKKFQPVIDALREGRDNVGYMLMYVRSDE